MYLIQYENALIEYDLVILELVPKWVQILPAANGIWSMIKTLRERGNHEIADNLQMAAEKQVITNNV